MSAEARTSDRLDALVRMAAARPSDPFVHYGVAMEMRGLGRGDEAARVFAELMNRFPDYIPTFLMAGQHFVALGRRNDAKDALSRGIDAATRRGDGHALSELSAALADLEAD